MKSGKLNFDELKSLLERNRGAKRREVIVQNGVGEDCSVIDFENEECVLSTDPVTASSENIGKIAININVNDIVSSGAEPIGVMVTILCPEGTEMDEIKYIMEDISTECIKYNMEILGGHTEITSSVNRTIVSCTVIGKNKKGRSISTNGAKISDDIIMTKYLALEGTNILVNEHTNELEGVLKDWEIKEAKEYINSISVYKEGIISGNFGVNSMHDVTEGGLLGALWEMAYASKTGFKLYNNKIPITNVTRKVCDFFEIDPLKLISSGSMIITTNNGDSLVRELLKNGITATIIGKVVDGIGCTLMVDGEEIEVSPPERDELFNIKLKIKEEI